MTTSFRDKHIKLFKNLQQGKKEKGRLTWRP